MHPPVRTLWTPSILYEAGNPRQRLPLDLYAPDSSASGDVRARRRQEREKRDAQAKYAARRDLMNVLRGKSTRMAWDYQAEAASISDDEREFEAQMDAHRSYGYEWLIPEGKAMNQEVEAEDDAINEEARITAANALVQQQQQQADAREAAQQEEAAENAIESGEDNVEVLPSREAAARRADGTRERPAQTTTSRPAGRNSGSGASSRPARTSSTTGVPAARAPPRASGRYSSGGGSASAAMPRYTNAANAASTSRNSGGGGRDLDADIPEAEEASYGASAIVEDEEAPDAAQSQSQPQSQPTRTASRRVLFPDSEDEEPPVVVRRSVVNAASRREDAENRQEDGESTDMDMSS